MKVNTAAIEELLAPLRQYFQKDSLTRENVNEKPPLRSELFTADQMEQHAQLLAAVHQLSHDQAPERLLRKLAENEEILFRVTGLLQETTREKKAITPAGEWLLDNFYLIEEQIRIGKRYLPKGYSKGLPKLSGGLHAGYPRVYDIATEIISHSDGHVDIHSLGAFISAYQRTSVLTIGELWAIPIMLRLALLENLRRVAARIAVDLIDTSLAHHWADRIIDVTENDPKQLVLVIADMARSNPPIGSAFVAEFARKLQWKGLDLTLTLHWFEQHLSGTGFNINAMVLAENQKQAADQLSVSNSISSLRFLSKIDWREFVEAMSIVDKVLREDPVYPQMDFLTRDHYRHRVERIAKGSDLAEHEVARVVIDLAKESSGTASHVGYYLIGMGSRLAEKKVRMRLSFRGFASGLLERYKPSLFALSVLAITATLSYGLFFKAEHDGVAQWLLVLVTIFSVLSASQLALALVNWVSTLLVAPSPLPKLDFSKGVPDESRTLVVVPTIISHLSQVDKLIQDLEVRFLANRDKNVFFALLTDFPDAAFETMPGDDAVLKVAQDQIIELNSRYGSKSLEPFLLFHRPRRYNPVEKIWMGYERKRGKLGELNQLLRGKAKDRFSLIVGEESVFTTIQYVITLDTDTQLPRDAAWKLTGLMAHPLNRAFYDAKKKRVTEGYGIIQPRIAISLHGATRTPYTRLNENDSGIDPYTRVTSDVYQDVFDEGSFIGKGIYDVDVFEKAVNSHLPENRILSHDLLEGTYARCGFASDIQLYEEYPPRYDIDISRRHRWVRGDWQIAAWIFPFAPVKGGGLKRNPISGLSQWKIFDNLRRSLIPFSLTALLLLSWTVLPSGWFWTVWVLATMFVPPILASLWQATRKPKEIAFEQHVNNALGATHKNVLQVVFNFVCLPYEAFVSTDAILRTCWRMFISQKRLLEWNPYGATKIKQGLGKTIRTMWVSPLIALATFMFVMRNSPADLLLITPLLALWLVAPAVAWWISRPFHSYRSKLTAQQQLHLRELSRKTWSFFEELVGPSDQWLPPDNLQQYPIPVIAHRTSPTNIGLALLSNLGACDFGYSTTSALIERTGNTFSSLQKLERYRGHFYNWYDTQTLKTLNPRYISTVDSGNMAAHLLTLRQGLLAMPAQPAVSVKLLSGIYDTIRVIVRVVAVDERAAFQNYLLSVREKLAEEPATLESFRELLSDLRQQFHEQIQLQNFEKLSEAGWWVHALDTHLNSAVEEIDLVAPWLKQSAVPQKFRNLNGLSRIPSLVAISELHEDLKSELAQLKSVENTPEEKHWLTIFEAGLREAQDFAISRIVALQTLAAQAFDFADMDYDFLYDKSQRLLAIGYSVDDRHRDASYYDLLASEARLSSFVAIAQGKIPQESWFALGRRLTTTGNSPVLLSWSGSMFEYLMPVLVMPSYENTLLDESCYGTVQKQIEYGHQQDVPWGVSESCYNLVDGNLIYQYRAFGIPGLGFKRGLGQDLVISPYATVMALMVDPEAAYQNLERLSAEGYEGRYGYYEAIDYTPLRLSRGQKKALIQTFMVHHQGMSFLSLAYLLLNRPMQKRFEADAQFQTSLLLLQEQVPKTTGYFNATFDSEDIAQVSPHPEIRFIPTSQTVVPEIQLLSNGRYHVMVTNAGGGYSRWKELAVTRWREDTTRDNWGTFCFVKDLDADEFWSTTHQPTLKEARNYEAIFSQGRVEFRRRDNQLESYTEIIVSPEDDIEVRRLHLTNHSKATRHLEITSYSEVVLALSVSDTAHPAFSNLFVQTEINHGQHAILCTRRPRSKDERPPTMFHLMKVNGASFGGVSYETDRSKFIGRGKTLVSPAAMRAHRNLSGSQGPVLDPIIAIRYTITLEPGECAVVDMITGIAATREENQLLIDKYQDRHLRDRAFELSWTHSQVVLRQIGATESDAQLFARLAGSVIFNNPFLRTSSGIIAKNQRGQSALWSYSISGDLPIVLLQVADVNNITLVRQLIKAQAYWNLKGLAVDLVILNEDPSGYRQVLQDQIQGLVAAGIGINNAEKQGRIFVRPVEQVSSEDLILLQTVARVIISDTRGRLADQVNKRSIPKSPIPTLIPSRAHEPIADKPVAMQELQFSNGFGGFSRDGTEYIVHTGENKSTPLPWVNVIANRDFGTLVSETGSSYTWSENAHEYRLTPWNNDPVIDSSGEAFYIRDEETGAFWSPAWGPATGKGTYVTRHGFGYSVFEHTEDGIQTELWMYVDVESAIKFYTLKFQNLSGRTRKLSATAYIEWVLGGLRSKSSMHVVTDLDSTTGTLMARNAYNTEFYTRVAFFKTDETQFHFTTDRTEFIGRNGTLQHPEVMGKARLSGKAGSGHDPCAAIQVPFALESGKKKEMVFKLGAGKDMGDALEIIQRFQGANAAADALENVRNFWRTTLGAVQVQTPDLTINILTNGWLLYQVLSCRLWGRSGFYQSGGAFGFRDQLQDVLAVIHTDPTLTRDQILLAASRQFREGDVQHWWHPPLGRGVRTLCSDDFLWLPFVTSRYIAITGDLKILDEQVPFLQGRQLNVNEESYYDLPIASDQRGSLYDHCKRAIQRGLRFGERGLPLIGSGDWNDGMNMVGIHGKGESVWLAFFLYDILIKFIEVARLRNDAGFVLAYEQQAETLKRSIHENAWDGDWYLRAFFDDGTPLGSNANTECKIDSITQSWSVLSGAGTPDRTSAAMKSASQYLINKEKGLIQLLDPPFSTTDMDPGYIKGYLPGVRENGGQYTHAAIWMIMAFAKLGDRKKTAELLEMINPIHHGESPETIAVYKAEPYVMAADVYGVPPHTGRGGWTWYTGSAGWMYQLILEWFLGLKKEGDTLRFEPCVPESWTSFIVHYRHLRTVYHIEVYPAATGEPVEVTLDGQSAGGEGIALVDDGQEHHAVVGPRIRKPSGSLIGER